MKRLFIAGHRGMVGSALVREAAKRGGFDVLTAQVARYHQNQSHRLADLVGLAFGQTVAVMWLYRRNNRNL